MEKESCLATVEDAVQYQLFLLTTGQEASEHLQEILQSYIEKIVAHFAPILVSYIWQNQPFNLKYKPAKGKACAHSVLTFLMWFFKNWQNIQVVTL